jgi:hypothetical protein
MRLWLSQLPQPVEYSNRPLMPRHITLLSLMPLISVLTVCSHPSFATPNPSSVTTKAVPRTVKRFWHPNHQAGVLRYSVRDSSILSISTDTVTKSVPFITTGFLQLSILTATDSVTFTGRADSILVQSELRKNLSTEMTLQVVGSASRKGTITQLQSEAPTSCKIGLDPGVARVSELLIPIPDSVSIGSQWTDTTTTVLCHGKVALRQMAVRSYRLTADTTWQTDSAIRVDRSTTLIISSLIPDSTNHISTTGHGSTHGFLILNPNSGALFKSRIQGTISLTITTSRGIFPFMQFSDVEIHQL